MIAIGSRSVQVAAATLCILTCLAGAPTRGESLELDFETQCFDLDAGELQDPCPEPHENDGTWDLRIGYHGEREVHAVAVQNSDGGAELAILADRNFDDVTAADIETADFTDDLVDEAFGSTRVVLLRTDQGVVFKLGNVVEASADLAFDYEQL